MATKRKTSKRGAAASRRSAKPKRVKKTAKGRASTKPKNLADALRDLISKKGYEIDVGQNWYARAGLTTRSIDSAGEQSIDLPYGSTERPGFELLQRPMQRTILKGRGGKSRSFIVSSSETHRFEPVPIETVVWDGQSSSTRQGDEILERNWKKQHEFDDERRELARQQRSVKRARKH